MPNLTTTTSIEPKTLTITVPTSDTSTGLSVGANQVIKLNSIIVSGTSSSVDVTVYVVVNSVIGYLANAITIPPKATLVVLSKDTGVYLGTGNTLNIFAGGSGSSATISYELITTSA
jgi:hypothetical protein